MQENFPEAPAPSDSPVAPLRRVSRAGRFVGDRSGAVAVIFALSLVAIAIMVGAAIEYSHLSRSKARLQAAVDSAALAAAGANMTTTTLKDRQTMASNIVASQFLDAAAQVLETETPDASGAVSYDVVASADVAMSFAGLLGYRTSTVGAHARAMAAGGASGDYEIALALDNTGSMSTVMGDLRAAATTFVNTVMTGPNVRVSVVPYVAAVNPGITDPAIIDMPAKYPGAIWNGDFLRWKLVAPRLGCALLWGSGGGGGGGASSSGDVGGSAIDMMEILNPFRRFARAVFGVAEAQAQVTGNTIAPIVTNTVTSPSTGYSFKVPLGFINDWYDPSDPARTGGCDWLSNGDIAHHELFSRVRTASGAMAQWKGCVEARPTKRELAYVQSKWGWAPVVIDDLDVKETPPTTADRNTLFVPYFWPDEPDLDPYTLGPMNPGVFTSSAGGYHNNYLPDGALPAGWNWGPYEDDTRIRSILKYDGATAAVIKETLPNTAGPNASCPDAVLRLTNNKSAVLAKISGLSHWYNGGTVISEGLMWAWRSLSPLLPYADGKGYGTPNNNKVIVLMTDGVNGLATNGGDASVNKSDYSSYGYLFAARMTDANSVTTFDEMANFLDTRTREACWNAKAAGVKVYTILFNHGLDAVQTARATNLLQSCATSAANFYQATDLTSLNNAFAAVSSNLGTGKLRLVK